MNPWACSYECWTLPYSILTDGMWNCDACYCGYENYMTSKGCTPCPNTEWPPNMVPIPSIMSDCSSLSSFTCNMGYYSNNTSILNINNNENSICQPCAKQIDVQTQSPCASGFYHKRCYPEQGPFTCFPCTQPPLPNQFAYAYGSQRSIPLCDLKAVGATYPSDESCALFLTPSWDRYECYIYCNIGFTNVKDFTKDNSLIPDCRPCIEVCGLGFACSTISNRYKDCIPCMELNNGVPLPANAKWLPDCYWTCIDGFYERDGGCLPCKLNQECFNKTQVFMGCKGTSTGKCMDVDLSACIPNQTYLHYEVYSIEATCMPCTQPILNKTFLINECTQAKDTQLSICSTQCAQPGFFIIGECTLTSDIQCQPCTIGNIGQLMLEACGIRSDASFTKCPEGVACDGTFNTYACPPPKIPKDGLCICPSAMIEYNQGCIPLPCDQGWYPNSTLNACTPCGDSLAYTIPIKMGIEACACPKGFYIEQVLSTMTILCWPCGDLQCIPEFQNQSPCFGNSTEEPQCLCQIPPGAHLLDPETCEFECAPGWEKSMNADMSPAWWTPTSFHFLSTNTPDFTIPMLLPDLGDTILLDSDLAIFVAQNTLHILYQKRIHTLNASEMLIQGRRQRLIPNTLQLWTSSSITSITSSSNTMKDRFWVGFTFETFVCAGLETSILTTCATVELIQVYRGGSCASLEERQCVWSNPIDCLNLPICVFLKIGIWGNTMQAGFNGLIWDMTGSLDTSMLYLLLNNNCVYAYPIQYYAPNTEQSQRLSDSLQNLNFCITFPNAAKILSIVDNTIYIPGNSKGPIQHLFKPSFFSKMFMSIENTHWLIIDQTTVIDLWNGVQWPLFILNQNQQTNSLSTIITLKAFAWNTGLWSNGSHWEFITSQNNLLCPLDTVYYPIQSKLNRCEPMQCIKLKNSCGSNSIRLLGTTICICLPGYYRSTTSCIICPANTYCPPSNDIAAPIPCGTNAISQPGASSVSECLCKGGYYPFQPTMCLPCPLGFWCLGGRTLPIPCINSGYTLIQGVSSPLSCICPARTHGPLCLPCTDQELCLVMKPQPQWQAIRLIGEGPSTLRIHLCAINQPIYSIPTTGIIKQDPKNYSWGWIIVTLADDSFTKTIQSCIEAQGLVLLEPVTVIAGPQTAAFMMYNAPCNINEEWPGETGLLQKCTCIAGYTTKRSSRTGNDVCVPCLNGTIRPRRSPITSCIPCMDNNSHAPWLAMSHCICKSGFYFDFEKQNCQPNPLSFLDNHSALGSPALMLSLSIISGLLCLLAWILAPQLNFI